MPTHRRAALAAFFSKGGEGKRTRRRQREARAAGRRFKGRLRARVVVVGVCVRVCACACSCVCTHKRVCETRGRFVSTFHCWRLLSRGTTLPLPRANKKKKNKSFDFSNRVCNQNWAKGRARRCAPLDCRAFSSGNVADVVVDFQMLGGGVWVGTADVNAAARL